MNGRREWTGSVSVLPESMRGFAVEMANLANEYGVDPATLKGFLIDHAYTLSEWADAVEQLYARLDEGEGITNAQGVALARFLRYRLGQFDNATVTHGGNDLPDGYIVVRMSDGYTGGIAPNGDTGT